MIEHVNATQEITNRTKEAIIFIDNGARRALHASGQRGLFSVHLFGLAVKGGGVGWWIVCLVICGIWSFERQASQGKSPKIQKGRSMDLDAAWYCYFDYQKECNGSGVLEFDVSLLQFRGHDGT
jgi:hypothetical protein